jgi:hypothetical protein
MSLLRLFRNRASPEDAPRASDLLTTAGTEATSRGDERELAACEWLRKVEALNESEEILCGDFGLFKFIDHTGGDAKERRRRYYPTVIKQASAFEGRDGASVPEEERIELVRGAVHEHLKVDRQEFKGYVEDYRRSDKLYEQDFWDKKLYPAASGAIVDSFKKRRLRAT